MEPLAAYLHYLAIIVTASFLVAELVLCRPGLSADHVRLLPRYDILFFASAMVALATGLVRLFVYGKGFGYWAARYAKEVVEIEVSLRVAAAAISFLLTPLVRLLCLRFGW